MQSLQKDLPQDQEKYFQFTMEWYHPYTTMQKFIKHAQGELITNPSATTDFMPGK